MIRTAGKTWKPGKRKTGNQNISNICRVGLIIMHQPENQPLLLIIINLKIMRMVEMYVQSARLRNHVLDCAALLKIDKR